MLGLAVDNALVKTERLEIRLEQSLAERLRAQAEREAESIGSVVRRAIRAYLEAQQQQSSRPQD